MVILMAKQQRPEVPAEVEQYLIGLYAHAGRVGGELGHWGGGGGGAAGAAFTAKRLKTKVEEHTGQVPGTVSEAVGRLTAAFPDAQQLPAADRLRLAVPVGLTGLQQIVMDAEFYPAGPAASNVRLRGFGKEGVISRSPTRKVTDQAWAALLGGVQPGAAYGLQDGMSSYPPPGQQAYGQQQGYGQRQGYGQQQGYGQAPEQPRR